MTVLASSARSLAHDRKNIANIIFYHDGAVKCRCLVVVGDLGGRGAPPPPKLGILIVLSNAGGQLLTSNDTPHTRAQHFRSIPPGIKRATSRISNLGIERKILQKTTTNKQNSVPIAVQ